MAQPKETLHRLTIDRGVQRVDVVCPGFVADCLETLEEIAQGKFGWERPPARRRHATWR